jgi:hypothetical protein
MIAEILESTWRACTHERCWESGAAVGERG